MKEILILIIVSVLIFLAIIPRDRKEAVNYALLSQEITTSRIREDLLLKEVKLLDYQLDVLSKQFLK